MTVIKNWVNVMHDIQTEENVEMFLRDEIKEVLQELNCKWGNPWDKVKELADVIWCATALIERMGYDSEKIMEKLRESNMSKTFETAEEAQAECPEGGEVLPAGDLFVCMNPWNKIMKPKNFINMGRKEVEECKKS